MDGVWAPSAEKNNWKAMDAEVAESKAEDVVDVVVPQDLVPPQFPEVVEAKAEDIVMPLPPVAQQQDLLPQQEEARARKKAASDAAKLVRTEERARKKVASDAAKMVATEKTRKKNAEAKLALAEAKKYQEGCA